MYLNTDSLIEYPLKVNNVLEMSVKKVRVYNLINFK